MPIPGPQLIAGGTIYPFRFLTLDVTDDHEVTQSTANAVILGLSGQDTNYPPLQDQLSDPQAHATEGQRVTTYITPQIMTIEAGEAIAAGTRCKSDSVGRAVAIETTGTTNQNVGFVTFENATAAGEKIRGMLRVETVRPALT